MSLIISPSLLAADFMNLEREIQRLNGINDLWIHLDVMDGHFVPNLSFGAPVIQNLSRLTQHKLDAHLMVTNPEFYAEAFKGLGLYNFTFHWEAALHQDRLISALKAIYPSVGISLNPATPLHLVPDYIWHKVDLVLLMSVNPGFGGQHFIPEVLQKVKDLSHIKHKLGCHFQIQVDGGVNQDNASLLKNAGAHNLVAGSFIFSEPHHDYINRINQLR